MKYDQNQNFEEQKLGGEQRSNENRLFFNGLLQGEISNTY